MTLQHERMARLLDYIVEQAKDIDTSAFNLAQPPGFLKKLGDLRDLPGVEFNRQEEGDHVWLSIQRLPVEPAPGPPEKIAPFVSGAPDPFGPPPHVIAATLAAHLEGRDEAGATRAAIERATDDFVRKWHVWAESEKPRRLTIGLYGELFALAQQLTTTETAAKPQELVWGVGETVWRMPSESGRITFDYPLLTQATEITVDAQTMVLSVRPRDVPVRVEFDAIAACVSTSADIEKKMRAYVQSVGGVSPFDASTYTPVLKMAGTGLDPDGVYREVIAQGAEVPAPSDTLVVTDAWVLFARPRSNNFLIDDIHRLKAKVEEAVELPTGPLAMVADPANEVVHRDAVVFRGLGGGVASDGTVPVRELFFPLPYNDEQVSIVRRLETSPGVAVQGPPGTGKTHSIANIICHYLATGRRVLVTSKGEPALEVLQEKIPEEVRALTVSLLSGDREGIRQCQASISAIQHQISQLDEEATEREIRNLQDRINRVHAELYALDRRVDTIARQQLHDIDVDGTLFKAQKLAELVMEGCERHDWFDDTLTLAAEHAPPLSETEAAAMRDARRRLGKDLQYLGLRLPNAGELPPVEKLTYLHDGLVHLGRIENQLNAAPEFALQSSTLEPLGAVELFLKRVDDAVRESAELEGEAPKWGHALRVKCRQPSFASERKALEALSQDIDTLTAERAAFLQRPVEISGELLADPKSVEAVERGAESGKPFGLLAFGAGEAKARLVAVRVAGLPVTDADGWTHVSRYIRLHARVTTFLARWNAFAGELGLPTLAGGVESLRRLEGIAHAARRALMLATTSERALLAQSNTLFVTPPTGLVLGTSSDLAALAAGTRVHLTKAQLAGAAVARSRLDERLASYQGPVADGLRAFAAEQLGQADVAAAKLSADYAAALAEVHRVSSLSSDLAVVSDAADRLRGAGGERWAQRLTVSPATAIGEDEGMPSDWRQAWTWARMRGHLASIEARGELRALATRREELTQALAKLYREMVARSAWLKTKQKTTHSVLQALMAFATAIGKIGKATGPNASMYRRNARESMDRAVGAVPCWIMSHARVSESAPAELGAFDLVIVDEASQSDIWALPAILRGKKILVVGDDKQVSPDGGFISAASVRSLRERFLQDQPYANAMTPGMSLYDLAAQVYAADQVMLREHFRCVAPVIAYSNKKFYQGAIQPLRTPKASERIDPPLVDLFVHGGVRDKHDRNPMEAEAIADEIGAILDNPKFAHCSLGVVSLLGMEQAKYIDEVVRGRFSVSELMRRKFECGDARTFQGSERDIMFLSMVADPGSHHALSGMRFDQRFNVAASRARDRMYLVRSVEADELSQLDLRLTLIEHFEKPMVADAGAEESLASLCESGFEREVFARLVAKGYRTVPQVKVGSFRIDLVVEGAQDRRLAIELDGDDHHGPDRWAHDMSRQRVLERAGWVFWRCFASTWSMSKEAVFAELLQRLDAMGIEPIGALERIPSLVERREYRKVFVQDAEQEVVELIGRGGEAP
ncbi:AAA domain-containing protein [Dokdonella sp.]|uniref:AAA domain-containing protein n=1 Tax=Dokdonella sp. TaxID=2291710 RepID=UPI002CC50F1E|nr:AAA domain-containing protein [Dokdonella sp.]HOX72160.1 AAA domain-containing protein [Dokdonella sp.]HPN77991.1 AAA domain-containing protein [Dokdonella sp.]